MKNVSNTIQNSDNPEILIQLRQKAEQLRKRQQCIKNQNKQLQRSLFKTSDEVSILNRQKDLQERKSKSLILLVTELQRQYDEAYLEEKSMNSQNNQQENNLQKEIKLLRKLLIKSTEKVKDQQKLLSFLKQVELQKNKADQFIKKSNFIENQTELIAKLKSQINSFDNQNYECKRKWKDLESETKRLESEQNLLKIQLQRLKTELKEKYEDYLQKLNQSKTKIVHFNQTQREKIFTEHFVEEMATLQEKRFEIGEENKNLHYHYENLLEESKRIDIENRQLRSFFGSESLNEETKLASKMKARIDQLSDILIQYQKIATIARPSIVDSLDYLRQEYQNIKETSDYIAIKIKDEEGGKIILNEKQIIDFFEKVLKAKDERMMINKDRQYGLSSNLKELSIKKQLLENQISNLEEALQYHDFQQNYYTTNNKVAYQTDQLAKNHFNTGSSHYGRSYN